MVLLWVFTVGKKAVIGVMAMVPIEMTVLVAASFLWRCTDLLEPFNAQVILDMNEHLLHGCIKRSIVLKPTWREVDPGPDPVVDVAFSPLATSIFSRCLLLFFLSFVGLRNGLGISLSLSVKGILSVHVLLCFHHEVSHAGQGVLREGE